MNQIKLGTTGIKTPQNAFGALPIQRVSAQMAVKLLRKAFDGGMIFFDTARAYSDSEEKLGLAFSGMRDKVFIATKTGSKKPKDFWTDLDTSLTKLKTDYIDIYQFHWPDVCYKPGDGNGMYECMLEAKKQGKIRHIGFTNHVIHLAHECIDSNLYETLQYPLSYLSSQEEIELVVKSHKANIGFIAMKSLAGGLIKDAACAFAFLSQFENVLPIWGIQRETELDQFLALMEKPATLTPERKAFIEKEKLELSGDFCRGCGYCMPCPVGIKINMCARMSLFIRRFPAEGQLTPESQEMMRKIENCTKCGKCKAKCPYNLDTPELLVKNYLDYMKILAGDIDVK
ncbi:MAG: aldo/keto reductase [Thermoguttaceae bacterium]